MQNERPVDTLCLPKDAMQVEGHAGHGRISRQGWCEVTCKAGRKRRSRHPRGVAGPRKSTATGKPAELAEEKDAEIARLVRDLAEAQARLREIEAKGSEAYTARKIESLLEAAQLARGQAFDASLARNRAEGELRALERAITEVRGPSGWLLRRAARRVLAQTTTRRDN